MNVIYNHTMQKITEEIRSLQDMAKYPEMLYYKGDLSLLERPRVSVVGARRLSSYTRQYTYELAQALSRRGVVVVSGAAMGVDAVAHQGAGANNTIAVLPSGIDLRYPATNAELIKNIEEQGLTLSQFEPGFKATYWSFVVRNELVVALGEVLIVAEAEEGSGSMRSAEYALKMGRPVFVLPQPLDRSAGTRRMLAEGKAEAIYDIEEFADRFGTLATRDDLPKDEFYYFCQKNPTLDEAVSAFGDRVFEAELEGVIAVEDGRVRLA